MVEITPQVDIQLVLPVCWIDGLSVPDHSSHYTKDLIVSDAVLSPDIMVTTNDIGVGANLQNAVEDVFVPELIKDGIVALGSSLERANLNDVATLTQKGHHAYANVGVNKVPLLL